MISTLNPKISECMAIVSVVVLIYSYINNMLSIASFFLGIAITMPIIFSIWHSIEKNWNDVYKKFYKMSFHNRDKKIVYKSWKLTWWIIPWTVFVYSAFSIAFMSLSNDFNVVLGMCAGSVFIISVVTHHKSPKYYSQLVGGKDERQ